MSVTITARQLERLVRHIREALPPVDDRSLPGGGDLATLVVELVHQAPQEVGDVGATGMVSGRAVILNGQTAIAIAGMPEYDGRVVVACFEELDGTNSIQACIWNGLGTLTITAAVAVGADRNVQYIIHGA